MSAAAQFFVGMAPTGSSSAYTMPKLNEKPSMGKVVFVFSKFFDLLRTVYFRFISSNIDYKDLENRISSLYKVSQGRVKDFAKIFNKGAFVGGDIVKGVMKNLNHNKPTKPIQYVEEASSSYNKSQLPKEKAGNLIFIPLILSGLENHIVAVIVDPETRTLDFYDPQGFTILERKNQKLVHPISTDHSVSLHTAITEICAKYQIIKVEENTIKNQKDCNNCGIFVSRYVEERSKGNSHQEAIESFSALEKEQGYARAIESARHTVCGHYTSYLEGLGTRTIKA